MPIVYNTLLYLYINKKILAQLDNKSLFLFFSNLYIIYI